MGIAAENGNSARANRFRAKFNFHRWPRALARRSRSSKNNIARTSRRNDATRQRVYTCTNSGEGSGGEGRGRRRFLPIEERPIETSID